MTNATEPLVQSISRIENPSIEEPDSVETTIDSETEEDILHGLDEDAPLDDEDNLDLEDDDTEIRR